VEIVPTLTADNKRGIGQPGETAMTAIAKAVFERISRRLI
jgi:hypothetical protein